MDPITCGQRTIIAGSVVRSVEVGVAIRGIVMQSFRFSFGFSIGFSFSNVESTTKVGQISATVVGAVGSNGGGGNKAGGVAGDQRD